MRWRYSGQTWSTNLGFSWTCNSFSKTKCQSRLEEPLGYGPLAALPGSLIVHSLIEVLVISCLDFCIVLYMGITLPSVIKIKAIATAYLFSSKFSSYNVATKPVLCETQEFYLYGTAMDGRKVLTILTAVAKFFKLVFHFCFIFKHECFNKPASYNSIARSS